MQYTIQGQTAFDSVNIIWLSICTYMMFFMQTGFTFLQAGSVRHKNLQSVILKNFLTLLIGGCMWWLTGFGFAFSNDGGKFLGGSREFGGSDFLRYNYYAWWLYQWTFCAITATIVCGGVAERIRIETYALYAMFMTGWIYPVVAHWCWGNGWLQKANYLDFAGGGVIHITGGFAALAGAIAIGKRTGRWEQDVDQNKFLPNNVGYQSLGTMILWFGWFGFNCGATVTTFGSNFKTIGRVGTNTAISATTAGFFSFVIHYLIERKTGNKFSLTALCNGVISGLVVVTSSANQIEIEGAFVYGLFSAFAYQFWSRVLTKLKIDDPLDSFAIHGGNGFLGLIMLGFFHRFRGVLYGYDKSGKLIGQELMGACAIAAWSFLLSLLFFLFFKIIKVLRVSPEMEQSGFDVQQHSDHAVKSGMDSHQIQQKDH